MPCQIVSGDCLEPDHWRAVYTTVDGCTWPSKTFCAVHGVEVAAGWLPPYNRGDCDVDEEPHPIQLKALERVT